MGARLAVVTLVPVLVQVALFYWIVSWAAGRGSGAGFMAIAALLILLVAVPMALIANVWMAKETGHWRFQWVFLVSLAQALLIPAVVFVYFVIAL